MLIDHPLLGPRDAAEFVYLGDAAMLDRPADGDLHAYLHARENPAGWTSELWYHAQGDRSWLVVERHTVTHEIRAVRLASDLAQEMGR